jgi:hypothetical protein
MTMHSEHATTERLRHDIDRGRARDKVDVSDPATAPLGTDSEAGGHAPSPEHVSQARALEVTAQPPTRTTFAPFAYGVFIAVLLAIAAFIGLFASG